MEIPRDWTFQTSAVAKGFDRHVREQLPWYDLISGAVAHIARHYMPHNGVVYDLGCSTGNIGRLLKETIEARHICFLPLDNSESMREIYDGPGKFEVVDIAKVARFATFDVAIVFLCLMFVPVSERPALLTKLRAACKPGGVIIIVDKVQQAGGYLGTVLSRLTLASKVASGVPANEVIAKELSLFGIQRPLTREELGPDAVQVFQFGEFAGWVISA